MSSIAGIEYKRRVQEKICNGEENLFYALDATADIDLGEHPSCHRERAKERNLLWDQSKKATIICIEKSSHGIMCALEPFYIINYSQRLDYEEMKVRYDLVFMESGTTVVSGVEIASLCDSRLEVVK